MIPCSFAGDNLVIIDNPIGDKQSSPMVMTSNAVVKMSNDETPSIAKNLVANNT